MATKRPSRGVSKAEWLDAGLRSLSDVGIAGLSVEGLARSLGIARAGFYWHFKDRDELLRDMLDYWIHEITEIITRNDQLLGLDPRARLTKTAEVILDNDLTRYEIPIRQWALTDLEAARAVRKANRMRLDFVRGAFADLGFKGDDLEMRAMMFTCYHTWELAMFPEISRRRRRGLIAKRIELLTRQTTASRSPNA
ncbi:MAG: TetR/AcrR family transcriptional regulator [Hyphomicrobiaceae bacterium]